MANLDTATLLRLHQCAYRMLLHIDRRAVDDPTWLTPEVVELLVDGSSCVQWLRDNERVLPLELLPEREYEDAFARLLASFFEVSFEVRHSELGGVFYGTRLQTRRRQRGHGSGQLRAMIAQAVRATLASEGVRLDYNSAMTLARREDLRLDARIVAYIHELRCRAYGESKGSPVHGLWRSIPVDVRTSLNEETVWLARSRIREAADALLRVQCGHQ